MNRPSILNQYPLLILAFCAYAGAAAHSQSVTDGPAAKARPGKYEAVGEAILTGADGRYSQHDLLGQILNPCKEINEQFAPIVVTRNNGDTLTGVVVNLGGDTVTINTDLSDP